MYVEYRLHGFDPIRTGLQRPPERPHLTAPMTQRLAEPDSDVFHLRFGVMLCSKLFMCLRTMSIIKEEDSSTKKALKRVEHDERLGSFATEARPNGGGVGSSR